MKYASLEAAKEAHLTWLRSQGLSTTQCQETLGRLVAMLVGFEPPDAKVPATKGQIYYDCWADKLYYFDRAVEFGYSSAYAGMDWQHGSDHAATQGELPLCRFYYDLARLEERPGIPDGFRELTTPLSSCGDIMLGGVTGLRVFIAVPKAPPAWSTRKKTRYVLTPEGNPLCWIEFSDCNTGMEVGLEYKGQKAKMTLENGDIVWKGLVS